MRNKQIRAVHLVSVPLITTGNIYTVEPLNKGHFGSRGFVLFSEVVLWWEVQANRLFTDLIYLDNMF